MRIAVLGGPGLMGRAIVRDLIESKDVSQVLVADINLEKAEELVDQYNSKKLDSVKADVSKPDDLAQRIKDVDVVINSTWVHNCYDVLLGCLKAGVHLVDLGGLYHTTLKQLAIHDKVVEADIINVSGCGAAPGVTNMFVAHAAQELDVIANVHSRPGVSGGGVTYSIRTVIDELTLDAVIFRDGEYKFVPPLSGQEIMQFPEPVGELVGFYSIHGELSTIARSFPSVKKLDVKLSFPADMLGAFETLLSFGLTSEDPIKVGKEMISPRDFLISFLSQPAKDDKAEAEREWVILRAIVEGTQEEHDVKFTYDCINQGSEKWNFGGVAWGTAVPPSIVAQMIGKGMIKKRGVLGPEACVPVEPFFEEMGNRGFSFTQGIEKAKNL
ncbi:MAG: saccharopine dehydrogenase family protein [Candidatus Thorarchaeota archaeon]|jgi:saccharopine dehydrogenase (NAD+, L-lysine-forming)